VTSAKSGRIVATDEGRWVVLDRGQQNEENTATGVKTLSSFESYRAMADEKARGPGRAVPPKAEATWALAVDGRPPARGELAWRLGLVFAAANLALLGIGMSAANPRHASNWNVLFALMAFFAYYNLLAASQAWVSSGRLGLGTALLLVHGSAFALGVGLVWWRDRGTGGVLPRRRRRRRQRLAT
jgi:lipopolysaccharide export system permease protein